MEDQFIGVTRKSKILRIAYYPDGDKYHAKDVSNSPVSGRRIYSIPLPGDRHL